METNHNLVGIPSVHQQWKKVFVLGGIAALLSFTFTVGDIVFGSMAGVDLTQLPQTAVERFAEFQQNWLLGLYHLDLLNVITAILMIPAYFALLGLHRNKNLPYAAFALFLSFIGTTLFVSGNSALSMMELSTKYYAAADDTQRMLIAAAGEAMLAQGSHGSLGVFIGFAASTIAGISMAWVMLNGKVFGQVASYLGFVGNILLLVYILLVTFVPALGNIAVLLAAPGGLMALAWTLLIGIKLLKMGRQSV